MESETLVSEVMGEAEKFEQIECHPYDSHRFSVFLLVTLSMSKINK